MQKAMGERENNVCEKECIFEDSLEIDFDYEFDVVKFYDFSRVETDEEVNQSEQWFFDARGYPPSPLVEKLNDLEESQVCSFVDGHHKYCTNGSADGSVVSSSSHGKKDERCLKPKAKSSTRTSLSRLLKPTASQLAKQIQQTNVNVARAPIRSQKCGSELPKFPGESRQQQQLSKCVPLSQSVRRSRSKSLTFTDNEASFKLTGENIAAKTSLPLQAMRPIPS